MNNIVFILGPSRTGSKIYMNILNQFSVINITPEINYINSVWRNFFFRKDFVNTVKNKVGDLNKDSNIPKLIDLMFSNVLEGSFWNLIKKRNINRLSLEKRILKSDRSFNNILKIVLEEHAKSNDKKIPGAKFPLHFSHISKILNWYPNCKIVFLIRDPRAIYASFLKIFSNKLNSKNKRIKKILTFWITIIRFKKAANIYLKYSHLENLQLYKFEDIIIEPEKNIKKLCNFLEIEFKPEMLFPPVFGSSYKIKKKIGFDKGAINRWKKYVSNNENKLIKIFTYKQMKELKYL